MKVIYALTFKQRLFGLSFKKNIDRILVIPNCNSVHTFFMKKAIDVYMTNKDKKVLYVFKNFRPFKVILPKKNVFYIYETPLNQFDFKKNDKMDF